MKLPVRIAIIGCGGMGSGHALAITGRVEERPDFTSYGVYQFGQIEIASLEGKLELAGIYDINASKQQWIQENGWRAYTSYQEMLDDEDVDVVLIATPNHLHKEQAIQAMRAGKHVLCEKPVMLSSKELEEVMTVSRETKKVFYPRQNRRWDYDFLVAKKVLEDGALGEIFKVESNFVGSRGIPGDWRREKACGGGMMMDWGVHLLDRLLQIIPGKIANVFCHCSHVTEKEVDDGFEAFMEFASGILVKVEVGTCHFISRPNWYICGTKGTAIIDNFLGEGEIVQVTKWDEGNVKPVLAGEGLTKTMAPRNENSTRKLPLPHVTVDRNELYLNLVDTIGGIAEPLVTAEQALRVLKLMEALLESDATNRVVSFEE